MEDIKIWCGFICIIAVVSGVLMYTLPEGELNKGYRALAGLILIFSVFSFDIKSVLLEFQDEITVKQAENSASISNQSVLAEDYARLLIEDSIHQRLSQAGIDASCKVTVEVLRDGITIKKITVTGCESEDERKTLLHCLSNLTGGKDIIEFSQ